MSSLLAPAGPSVLDRAGDVLTEACDQRLWAQSDLEVVSRVEAALRVRAQADSVLLAAVGEVEASMLVRTAKSLREGFESTGLAQTVGDVSLAQTRVVIRSVTDLPDDLDPGMVSSAETLIRPPWP